MNTCVHECLHACKHSAFRRAACLGIPPHFQITPRKRRRHSEALLGPYPHTLVLLFCLQSKRGQAGEGDQVLRPAVPNIRGPVVTIKLPLLAPEQFGDTILFTTDDDILEAIFCYDESYDEEVESVRGLRYEEELKRPRTADGEGDERPFTQAGSRLEDKQVQESVVVCQQGGSVSKGVSLLLNAMPWKWMLNQSSG